MQKDSLLTFKQFCEKNSAFTVSGLRWLRFNARDNGFQTAFKKVGGRVLIDEEEFFNCIELNNAHPM